MEIIIGLVIAIVVLCLVFQLLIFLLKALWKALPYILMMGGIGLVIYGLFYIFQNRHGNMRNVFNFISQTVYFSGVFIGLFLGTTFLSEVFKYIKLRWMIAPLFIFLIALQMSLKPEGYMTAHPNAFRLAVLVSMLTYFWSIFQFIKIKRHIGFNEVTNNNLMISTAGIVSAFLSINLYVLDFPNNLLEVRFNNSIYINILMYLFLISAAWILYSEVNIYKKVKAYIKSNLCFVVEDVIEIPVIAQQKEKKIIYTEQILLRMKKHRFIIEVGKKEPIFIRKFLYKKIAKEVAVSQNIDEIIESIIIKYKIQDKERIREAVLHIASEKIKTVTYKASNNTTVMPSKLGYEGVSQNDKPDIITELQEIHELNVTKSPNIETILEGESIVPEQHDLDEVIKTNFKLLRYNMSNHPGITAQKKYRFLYTRLFKYMLEDLKDHSEIVGAILDSYQEKFQLSGDIQSIESKDIELEFSKIRKKEFSKLSFFKYRIRDYRYVLFLEVIYFRTLLEGIVPDEFINLFCSRLKINVKIKDLLIKYIDLIVRQNNLKEAEMLLLSCSNKYLIDTIWFAHANMTWNEIYSDLPRYNVAVCSTMSSGKSTFINALLGKDYIPSKNEACTAKITSISDDDRLNTIIGMKVDTQDKKVYEVNVNLNILEVWNNDNEVEKVILESNLDGIRSDKGVVVVHDTPGTNYSQDKSHHDITMNFLKTNAIDTIIYIINGEHATTMDNQILLKQIKREILENKSTKILFLVNKIDSFDSEKDDDIVSCLDGIKNELIEYGYSQPIVIPISANAARLFKMVLNGQALSKKETMSFKNLFDLFFDEGLDLLKYIDGYVEDEEKETEGNHDTVVVGGSEYRRNDILIALKRTGIGKVESILDHEVNN